ncbi:hypothetical protein DMP23_09530 [Amycolatopsis sp. A1MSW2902]|uniref:acyl-CoA dehydrogenase family protein n=1 Tax=Amycolatopsis sp. A1MSW2902 TaxID=687413 RepID=UPI00307E209C
MESALSTAVVRAEHIAEHVLFPTATEIDLGTAELAPRLDVLAKGGFYGLAGPVDAGGLGLDLDSACRVIELFSGACLTTTLVWMQNNATVLALSYGDNAHARDRWLARLCSGEQRSGIALSGARLGANRVRAQRTSDGYLLHGSVDWVTGWGLIDLLRVAAIDEGGRVVSALVDTPAVPSVVATPLEMEAVARSRTVRLTFDGHFVPDDRVLAVRSVAGPVEPDIWTTRVNTALRLGLAARAVALAEDKVQRDQIEDLRVRSRSADVAAVRDAGVAAVDLALRASGCLFVAGGSRSMLAGSTAGRLAREALFLSVFGSSPAGRTENTRLWRGQKKC